MSMLVNGESTGLAQAETGLRASASTKTASFFANSHCLTSGLRKIKYYDEIKNNTERETEENK